MSEYVEEGAELEIAGSLADVFREGTKIVTARGTEDGLVLRIDGRADWPEITADIEAFLGQRRKFFEGGEVSIEWLDRLPTKEQGQELEDLLKRQYGITIVGRRRRELSPREAKAKGLTAVPADTEKKKIPVTIPLFNVAEQGSSKQGSKKPGKQERTQEHLGAVTLDKRTGGAGSGSSREDAFVAETVAAFSDSSLSSPDAHKKYMDRMERILGEDIFYEDDANAKVIFGTLRSGQRIETPFSLIVVGDVNPGADLIAGGDIIIFGSLRGTAHASAYDDESPDRVIIAFNMQPIQLRIGSVISRGSDDAFHGAEIARIEDRRIIVEQYNPRMSLGRKLR